MHEKLLAAITADGHGVLADALGIGPQEVSKKIRGDNGFKLDQIAKIFTLMGIDIVTRADDVIVVPQKKYDALVALAYENLGSEYRSIDKPRVVSISRSVACEAKP
jgi:hypothetical protein